MPPSPTGSACEVSSGCERGPTMTSTVDAAVEDSDPAEILNPATEEVIATVAFASQRQTDAAIARAAAAYPAWRAVTPSDRARLLRRFAQVVDDHLEEVARLEVRNAGPTIGNARLEAGNVRDVLNYYSATPERLNGMQIPVADG